MFTRMSTEDVQSKLPNDMGEKKTWGILDDWAATGIKMGSFYAGGLIRKTIAQPQYSNKT